MVRISRTALLALTSISGGAVVLGWSLWSPTSPNLAQHVQAAYDVLDRARAQHTVQYDTALNWQALPDVPQVTARKALFIAKMLPLIAEENERILGFRAIAERAPRNSAQFQAVAYSYGLKSGASRRAVLMRVDQIPESLTLAQAAIESAWGTSRFAREGYAYFGERTYNMNTPGMAARRATGFKVKRFSGMRASVRSFMMTLNSHRAYAAFRAHRAERMAQGFRPSGLELAPFLHAYSEIGGAYIQRITLTIRANQLSDFDGIEHIER